MKKKWFSALLRQRFFVIILFLLEMWAIAYPLVSGSAASIWLSRIFTLVSLAVCLYIVAKQEKGAYKLTWVFTILLFPVFGGLFYLIFHLQTSGRRIERYVAAVQAKADPLLSASGTCLEAACEACPESAPQLRYLQQFARFPVYAEGESRYLPSGEALLCSLLQALRRAESYIFLEFFIVQEGIMWDAILDVLKEKARQGVKVRVMYDDVGCFLLLPKDYPKRLAEFGIECAVFNPFRPVLTTVHNNRDHRKIAVIDGKVAFTGGVNLADEYINARERFGHWKDAALRMEGPAAWSFALMFLQHWELCTGKGEAYAAYHPGTLAPCPGQGFVQPYADSPLDQENVGEQVYLQIINSAKRYVYINTPYLIPDDSLLSALCLAAKSGVDVRIVTPHRWDKWAVHMTTRSYYRELIGAGVRIYEYSKGFIHSKMIVSDDLRATVGTTNFDFRSLYLHFECGAVLYHTQTVEHIKEEFLDNLQVCQEISEDDCKCSLAMRLFQDVLRLFAPLM